MHESRSPSSPVDVTPGTSADMVANANDDATAEASADASPETSADPIAEDDWRAESGELDEEQSPLDVSQEEQVMIFLQLVDRQLKPRAGVTVQIQGAGLPEPRTVTSDDQGEVLIEDCGPGAYVLRFEGKQVPVYALSHADLETDATAYRVLI